MIFEKPEYKKYIVLCRDSKEWEIFCNDRIMKFEKYGLYEGEEYFYASSENSIRGLMVDGIIECEKFWERNDFDELVWIAECCVRI